uniref:Uncharacterized protein n=1 Tax=Caenorhabditis tropicalis TaxID=1561998 RepID=A0A1I7UHG7_9PELO
MVRLDEFCFFIHHLLLFIPKSPEKSVYSLPEFLEIPQQKTMLFRLFLLLSFIVLCHSIVSEISHRFLHRDTDYDGPVFYEPIYRTNDFVHGAPAKLSPLYGMTNSHLLNLADLLRKRTETQTPY